MSMAALTPRRRPRYGSLLLLLRRRPCRSRLGRRRSSPPVLSSGSSEPSPSMNWPCLGGDVSCFCCSCSPSCWCPWCVDMILQDSSCSPAGCSRLSLTFAGTGDKAEADRCFVFCDHAISCTERVRNCCVYWSTGAFSSPFSPVRGATYNMRMITDPFV